MAKIQFPINFQKFTQNKSTINVNGATLLECLNSVWMAHPEVKEKILNDKGNLQRYVRVFLDGQNCEELGGLKAPVTKDTTIKIFIALAGG